MGNCNEFEEAVHTGLEEAFLHVLSTAREEEVELDAVTLGKPLRRLAGLELEVVLARTDLNLDVLNLNNVGLSLDDLLLLLEVVDITAVVHDLTDRWDCLRGDLDKVEAELLCLSNCVFERKHTKILALRTDYSDLGDADLLVYSDMLCLRRQCEWTIP